jgi:hypothetical protein
VWFKYYNNTTSNVRTAIATFSGVGVTSQTVTLTQEPTPVFFTVSDDSITIGSTASNSEYITVTTDIEQRPWIATSNQTWLSVTSAVFFGTNTLYFDAGENSTSSERTAIVSVHTEYYNLNLTETVTIIQEAGGGSSISQNLPIADTTVSNTEIACFNAYDTIAVAGIDTVEFLNGSTVDIIAGGVIQFLPGFHAFEGSEMHASITTDNTFCEGASGSPVVYNPPQKSYDEKSLPEKQDLVPREKSIKVYPNPNNGQFKIELINYESGASIEIYNILGAKIYQSESSSKDHCDINLPGLEKGIYVVKITSQKEQVTKKITVN